MKYVFYTFFVICFLFVADSAHAASLYFEDQQFVNNGNVFSQVTVYLDTEGDVINTIGGEVNLSSSAYILSTDSSNETISHWIQPPLKTSQQTIDFSGMMVGGVSDSKMTLFKFVVVIHPPSKRYLYTEPNTVRLWLEEGEAYLDDGMATPAGLTTMPFTRSVWGMSHVDAMDEQVSFADLIPPEEFVIEYIAPGVLGDQAAVVFSAQDYQTGISHYRLSHVEKDTQVGLGMEFDENFVQSPYFLDESMQTGKIIVAAVDQAGNQRFSEVRLGQDEVSGLMLFCFGGCILVIGLIIIYYVFLRKK